jgi:hypothetical protein
VPRPAGVRRRRRRVVASKVLRRDDPLAVLSAGELEFVGVDGCVDLVSHIVFGCRGHRRTACVSILTKVNRPEMGDDHHRGLAAVTFLGFR